MNEKDYRATPAFSGTDARRAVSDYDEWHFEQKCKADLFYPFLVKEPTEAMEFGTAVHFALLEPEVFAQNVIVMPHVESFATKEGKAIKAAAEEEAKTKFHPIILKAKQMWSIEHLQNNFEKVRQQFQGEWKAEHSFFSSFEDVAIKGRIDLLTPDTLVDLKTTRDITSIEQTIASEHYHIQIAHYLRLAPRRNTSFIFLENKPPFRVVVHHIDDDTIRRAHIAWEMVVRRVKSDGLFLKEME
jgi:hypothetical protein